MPAQDSSPRINPSFGPVGRAASQRAHAGQTPLTGEIGRTGLRQWGGYVLEEWLTELQGRRGAELYREMGDQDPIIAAMLHACEMLVRRVTWWVEPATTTNPADVEAATFLEETYFEDMDVTWSDLIAEVLSMLQYGYSLFETVYKRRGGDVRDPARRSKFTDGRIGIRKLAIRGQDTLLHWEIDDFDEVQAMVQQPPPTYATLTIPMSKALLFRTKVWKGNPEGVSVLRRCVRPYYFKKNLENLRGIGLERDLAGLPMLTPPENVDIWNANDPASAQLLSQAQTMVSQVRRDELEGVVKPYGWTFELLKSGGPRQIDINAAINYYDQRMAMSMLADMITLGADKVGSYALAGAKKDLFAASLEAFLDSIASVFNTFMTPRLFKLNGWQGLSDWPKLCHGPVEDVDLETLAVMITALAGAGAPLFAGDMQDELLNTVLDRMGLPSTSADDTSEGE